MDDAEAREVLRRRVAELRRTPYSELCSRWLGQADCERIPSPSGVEYQVEIEAVWADQPNGPVLLLTSIDDGHFWRALSPITDSFVMAPDGAITSDEGT
jgi:hypothetical protein